MAKRRRELPPESVFDRFATFHIAVLLQFLALSIPSLTREQPTGPSHTGSFLSVQVRPAGDGSTVRVRSGVLNDAQVIEVRNPASPRKQTQGFSKIGS